MAYVAATPFAPQFFDSNGDPLASGTVEFYVAGTSTPATAYSDSSGTSLGTSATLNSRGVPQTSGGTAVNIFYDTTVTYKLRLKNSAGTYIDPDTDPFTVAGGSGISGADFEYASVAALIASSGNTGYSTIYVSSYYAVTYPSTAGPKGGFYAHRTGGTNSSPTVGTDPGVSSIGTGTQAGYYWDADGTEFEISLVNAPFNVLMFGAKGDGSTDDSTAIQDALNYVANSQNGNILIFPSVSNNYRLESGLTLSFTADTDVRVELRGEGPRSSLVAAAAIAMLTVTTTVPNVRRFDCNKLFFNCNSNATNGIVLNNCAYDRIIDCHFANVSGAGNDFIHLSGASSRNMISRNVFVHAASNAAGVRISDTAKNNFVIDNQIGEDIAFGVDCESGTKGNIICNNNIDNLSGVGIRLTSSDRNLIQGNVFEDIASHGINCITSNYNLIDGNQFFDTGNQTAGSGDAAIRIAGSGSTQADYNKITNNIFQSSDDYDILLVSSLVNNTDIFNNTFDDLAATAKISDSGTNTYIGRNNNYDHVEVDKQQTFADADATPSVANGNVFYTANTGSTTITGFDDGVANQVIVVRVDGNTTVQDNANLRIAGNFVGVGTNDTITLMCLGGANWIELSRSTN